MTVLEGHNSPDWHALALAMAEAIKAQRGTRSLTVIGHDGRMRILNEHIEAQITMDLAEAEFRKACT